MTRRVLVCILLLGPVACNHSDSHRPVRYVIDRGVAGWVKVVYDTPDAPPLAVEDGFSVIHISSNLKVATRSHMTPSDDGSEFYYQNPDGKRVKLSRKDGPQRLIWAFEKKSDSEGSREDFFVGREDQFTRKFIDANDLGTGLSAADKVSTAQGQAIDAASAQAEKSRLETDLTK